ncbi:MauE/DoxX family redox-associated membrane protein [Arsenicicoccus bolidensis]|uniref:DoxX family membrane protein n=1 Tax=Arsenicicoccus bolidensis TaxID=229480 RepID=A0ABS9Q1B4_9MICO|nr:MauE/DoxX family redox-associated membrane protein [Arsenicicoccus bolidensis]MCG7321671.1 DoxX family membrane protein [Arsenicicoccus bolidensis]
MSEWVGLVARLVLGVVLVVSGYLKVGSLESSAEAVRAFKILPYDLANLVGYVLPVLELAIGALLVLGLFTRIAGIAGALLMVAFLIGIVSVWVRGISIDCGCFGGGGVVAPEDTNYLWDVVRDVGLLLCGVWLAVRPRTPASMDRWLFGAPTAH